MTALTRFADLWLPSPPIISMAPQLSSTMVIAATGAKIHMIGRVWNKDGTSKNITKVGFRFGAVTKAGGSGLTLSLQDVDTANGPVIRGDGVQDQTVAIAAAAVTTGTYFHSAALSATRTVAFGALIAVVLEYDGGGRLGADTYTVSGYTAISNPYLGLQSTAVLENPAATFTQVASTTAVILEFDDGTFGTLTGSFPHSAGNTVSSFNSSTTPDERALEFTVPVATICNGGWWVANPAAGADFDMVLYDGTTALATVSVDSNALAASAAARFVYADFADQTLVVGTTYRWAIKPTTTNSVTVYDLDVNTANHMQAYPGGTAHTYNTRTDAGAWGTATTTKKPFCGIRLCSFVDATSAAAVTARVIGG